MNKIAKWLDENGIEYSWNSYGNPCYFNDGFSVQGIHVPFYFDGIGNSKEKEKILIRYINQKRSYVCASSRFGAGYSYRIMTVFDARRLESHENQIKEASEKFWQEEHARRMKSAKKTA